MDMPSIMYLDFTEEPDYVSASWRKHDEESRPYIRGDIVLDLLSALKQIQGHELDCVAKMNLARETVDRFKTAVGGVL